MKLQETPHPWGVFCELLEKSDREISGLQSIDRLMPMSPREKQSADLYCLLEPS